LTSATNQEKIKIMTLQNALDHFKNLESKTTKKSEIKIYHKFIQILTSLENCDLSDVEIQSIEQQLDSFGLNSNSTKNRKYFTRTYDLFQNYLKDTFALTIKDYYTNMGLGLGVSFGIIFGIVLLSNLERSLGISFGIALGMLIGLAIGRNLDSQAKATGKMLL